MIAMDPVIRYAVQYGMQALEVLGIFAIGIMASRWVGRVAPQQLERQTLDPPVRMPLANRR